ncbi:hypothetical protein JQN72_10085 [Phycicoccus sp. CSK15P-2]|uniref:hypothetical protein n=1 Tax=Phycicoccus sp. CSK15P-2 TaxID=2807627 RepID=UPI0019506729|nr:hypothetical protein [Phycicoccus sp. CSK15P-2]MBM6404588.1 hypothetical protein [Phycicoccus sp. CSK15P-2]
MTAALLCAVAVLLWPRRVQGGLSADGVRTAAVARWWRASASRVRRRPPDEEWAADLAEVTAVGVRAGLDLAGAVRVAARSPIVVAAAPWVVDHLAPSAPDGGPVAGRVSSAADRAGDRTAADLRVLARAWRLSEDTGAAASHTTAAAAAAIRAREADHARTRAALAGPRTSMRLLSGLPLVGPVLAALVGLDPMTLYASTPARLSVAAGLVATCAGWLWGRAVVRRAARPRHTDGGVR